MKKAKNEPFKNHSKLNDDFEREGKGRRSAAPQKQKKPLSIYDNFDEDEEIDEYLLDEEDDEDSDSIWDYMDDDDEL
ncbi:MAG: hypothetical protein ACOX0M_10190 [Salinivirgaceae bacterium]|jgi:hypothetical protein|nr:hypothetical protein [Bacteroidales bacterium]